MNCDTKAVALTCDSHYAKTPDAWYTCTVPMACGVCRPVVVHFTCKAISGGLRRLHAISMPVTISRLCSSSTHFSCCQDSPVRGRARKAAYQTSHGFVACSSPITYRTRRHPRHVNHHALLPGKIKKRYGLDAPRLAEPVPSSRAARFCPLLHLPLRHLFPSCCWGDTRLEIRVPPCASCAVCVCCVYMGLAALYKVFFSPRSDIRQMTRGLHCPPD